MKGSVRKRGKKWSYRIDLGKNGDQRSQIEKGGYATKREADKALADALYQINNTGDYVENQKITFSQVFTEFIYKRLPVSAGGRLKVSHAVFTYNAFAGKEITEKCADQRRSFYLYDYEL